MENSHAQSNTDKPETPQDIGLLNLWSSRVGETSIGPTTEKVAVECPEANLKISAYQNIDLEEAQFKIEGGGRIK